MTAPAPSAAAAPAAADAATSDTAATPNPLLDFSGLPKFAEFAPEHVTPAVSHLLAQARATIDHVTQTGAPVSWEAFFEQLEGSPFFPKGAIAPEAVTDENRGGRRRAVFRVTCSLPPGEGTEEEGAAP